MEQQLSKKEQRRKRLYAYVGKQKFVQNWYIKSKVFQQQVEAIAKECHTSINTLSIMAWANIYEKGELTQLLKVKRDVSKLEINALNYIFKQMREEYIKMFGWGTRVKKIKLIKEIVTRRFDLMINDDITQLTFIKIAQGKLDSIEKNSTEGSANIIELSIMIKNILQVDFKLNECTVAEFYTYLQMAEKQIQDVNQRTANSR